MRQILLCTITLFIIQMYPTSAQNDSIKYPLRKGIAIGSSILGYGGSLTGLYFLWYSDYSSGAFHSFNDNKEWYGIDKMGHGTTAFHVARVQSDIFLWSGMPNKKAVLWGSGISLAFLSTIEIFDGFSDGWGFSPGDMLANFSGVSLFATQELFLKERPVNIKFSMRPSKYAEYNPELLGENFIQQTLKDYNGQTYWLSFNIASCLKPESNFPDWLCLDLGYGADGMIGATSNPDEINGNIVPNFKRYPQFYLSPDIDFSKINIRNPWLAFLVKGLNFIKIPAPALEWNRENGMKFHALYF
ncbi:MAG: DUF2279 domain-containing protein [Bacteroidales bacterium]|nr:DUF2279 domain-containing protein [Bacteroidales bacterium]